MPRITLITKYKKNEGVIMSPEELLLLYFYAVNINNSTDGSKFDDYTTKIYIKQAQQEVEKFFDIKLFPKLISEKLDYYRDDYQNSFPFIRTNLPVRVPRTLIGQLNNIDQIRYPEVWLQSRTTNEYTWYRQFSVIPNGSTVQADANVILIGITANYGLRAFPHIPNYWFTQYETGYEVGMIPIDLVNLIGLMASVPLFALCGDIILGAGISSMSLGIDGLSQSIATTSSATAGGYSARIIEYRKSINETVKRLKRYYKGITFASL